MRYVLILLLLAPIAWADHRQKYMDEAQVFDDAWHRMSGVLHCDNKHLTEWVHRPVHEGYGHEFITNTGTYSQSNLYLNYCAVARDCTQYDSERFGSYIQYWDELDFCVALQQYRCDGGTQHACSDVDEYWTHIEAQAQFDAQREAILASIPACKARKSGFEAVACGMQEIVDLDEAIDQYHADNH